MTSLFSEMNNNNRINLLVEVVGIRVGILFVPNFCTSSSSSCSLEEEEGIKQFQKNNQNKKKSDSSK
ncbi:hypothetical protein PPL_03610 [Heterostelium album PN500]|uniref:Uncharacterized protein n=1 Tax=Heterostelium pallidum (strain ATCC 26659 / Pp 5 / PN500) TaxID=670386 RepID=D3B597_HETP5|nr:hypothetical protein PPL_03610 [Heterostelium album PN500]EFA83462.1 hypothetical protein PPL_03610 [Heterostelium album PN500]|eukprot:XP_020435579.1 hypothetical protein PPL_03610 [Heterostelium album PN500]